MWQMFFYQELSKKKIHSIVLVDEQFCVLSFVGSLRYLRKFLTLNGVKNVVLVSKGLGNKGEGAAQMVAILRVRFGRQREKRLLSFL